MSLTVRGILVLVIGTVLGITVSVGGEFLSRAEARRLATEAQPDPAAVLADVIARVEAEYVDQIEPGILIESAIRGIIEELDGHSRFLDEMDYEDIRIAASGRYAGIGLDMTLRDGRPTVIAPIPHTPAERAGIRADDVIVAVDGGQINADNFHEMVARMRGPIGSSVIVAVEREGVADVLEFDVLRADIQVRSAMGSHLGDGFGYVRLSGFAQNTATGLDQAVEQIEREAGRPLRGLVLDLRHNPGGILEAAVDVADRFIDEGLIVRGSGRIPHARFEHRAQDGHMLEDTPVVVLVDSGSASASEIVAGALRDHNRARIVGTATYGKGSVQTVMPLTAGSALKITTSRYILPSGRTLSGNGLEPDIHVTLENPRRRFTGDTQAVAISEDRQLLRALQSLGYRPFALSQAL